MKRFNVNSSIHLSIVIDRFQDGYLRETDLHLVRAKLESSMDYLRPRAVSIVDSFDLKDEVLQSALGRYDGRVYERLYEFAKNSPLNKFDVHPSCGQYLQPLWKSKL